MEKKAADLAEEKNMDLSTIINQQKANEKSRSDNRKIRYTLHKLEPSAVNSVEVDSPEGSIELTSKSSIERACLEENFKKYTQTSQTTCMQEPFRSLLGSTGHSEFGQSILKGSADVPSDTPIYAQEFLQHLTAQLRTNNQAQCPLALPIPIYRK